MKLYVRQQSMGVCDVNPLLAGAGFPPSLMAMCLAEAATTIMPTQPSDTLYPPAYSNWMTQTNSVDWQMAPGIKIYKFGEWQPFNLNKVRVTMASYQGMRGPAWAPNAMQSASSLLQPSAIGLIPPRGPQLGISLIGGDVAGVPPIGAPVIVPGSPTTELNVTPGQSAIVYGAYQEDYLQGKYNNVRSMVSYPASQGYGQGIICASYTARNNDGYQNVYVDPTFQANFSASNDRMRFGASVTAYYELEFDDSYVAKFATLERAYYIQVPNNVRWGKVFRYSNLLYPGTNVVDPQFGVPLPEQQSGPYEQVLGLNVFGGSLPQTRSIQSFVLNSDFATDQSAGKRYHTSLRFVNTISNRPFNDSSLLLFPGTNPVLSPT